MTMSGAINFKGSTGTVDVFPDRVVLTPNWLARFNHRQQVIPFSDVVAVHVASPTTWKDGYIAFLKQGDEVPAGMLAATRHPNSVMFGSQHRETLAQLHTLVEGKLSSGACSDHDEGATESGHDVLRSRSSTDGIIPREKPRTLVTSTPDKLSLEPCPNCRRSIATTAAACPKCGQPLTEELWTSTRARREKRALRWTAAVLTVGALLGVIGYFTPARTVYALKTTLLCKPNVDYAEAEIDFGNGRVRDVARRGCVLVLDGMPAYVLAVEGRFVRIEIPAGGGEWAGTWRTTADAILLPAPTKS